MSWDEHTSRLSVSRVLLAAIWTIVKPDYRRPFQDYPINRLRNIGIHAAPTDVVFVIDADFVPDPLLFDRARSSVYLFFIHIKKQRTRKKNNTCSPVDRSRPGRTRGRWRAVCVRCQLCRSDADREQTTSSYHVGIA